MKNRLFAIGAMILMMTSCTQDELISSDKGKEPATAGSCLTLVGLSSPQTRVSIGDKTGVGQTGQRFLPGAGPRSA